MTSAVLPPAPNWFSAQILRCSDSGGFVAYGAKHCVIVVKCQPEEHFSTRPDNVRAPSPVQTSKSSNWRSRSSKSRSPTPSNGEAPIEGLSAENRVYPGVTVISTAFSNKCKVTSLAWSPDSTQLVAACDEGQVVLMNVQEGEDGKTPIVTPVQMHSVHKNEGKDNRYKVNTVSWSRPNPDMVVSGDEIGNLVVWDVKANTTRLINVGKHNVFVLECHPYSPDVVAFGCKLGLALIVNLQGNGKIKQRIRCHDEDIQGLSWSPSKQREVFLGGERSVKVTKAKPDTTDEEVAAATASAAAAATVAQPPEDESLLVVSSRDKSLTIWSERTGRQVAVLKLPGSGGNRNNRSYENRAMNWTTCFWWKREILFSSGVHGELLEWNLDKVSKKTNDGVFRSDNFSHDVQVVHKEHARTLYSIHSTGASIQTSGQDRGIMSFHWDSHTLDWILPAFASWVYACVPNSVDPTVVAIGAGDAQIRIWKIGSSKALFDINTIWQKLNSAKITALAWHPEKDNVLAFGTDEGRVGTLDAFNPRSQPSFNDFKHRGQVYSLAFGPAVGHSSSASSGDSAVISTKKVLYSCGDGVVMMHDYNAKTLNVDEVVNASNSLDRKQPSRSDMAFQPMTYKFFIMGSDEGTVEIFSMPNLEIVAVLKSYTKLIQSLAWHPTYVGSSSDPSAYKDWVATSSNESVIHVWDLSNHLKQSPPQGGDAAETSFDGDGSMSAAACAWPILTEPSQCLVGHHGRVISVNWSPHEDGKLVSVSYDCTVQVWDVAGGGKPVANFSGHGERLFCGIWSPADPNVIFSGGEDSSLQCWKIDSQKDTLPVRKQPLKKHLLNKNVQVARDTNAPPPLPDSTSSALNEAFAMLEAKKKELMKTSGSELNDTNITSSQSSLNQSDVSDCKEAKNQRPRKSTKKEYFQLAYKKEHASKDLAFEDCQKLYEFLYGSEETTPTDKSPASTSPVPPAAQGEAVAAVAATLPDNSLTDRPHLGFFADKFGMDNLIDIEAQQWKEQGQEDAVANLMLWSGDIGETIKAAINGKGKLNDWLVSIAAGVSYPLWKEACAAYARQLIKNDDVIKGVSYYLMTHQVLEAIAALRDNHQYRAAIAVAKTRFPDDVPLIRELYTAWAYQAQNDGQFELAAKNWIAASELSQAASILAKRSDPSSLRVSSFLAMKAGENDKCRNMALHCIQVCVNNRNLECIDRLVEEVKLPEVIKAAQNAKMRINEEVAKTLEGNNPLEKEESAKTETTDQTEEVKSPKEIVADVIDNVIDEMKELDIKSEQS